MIVSDLIIPKLYSISLKTKPGLISLIELEFSSCADKVPAKNRLKNNNKYLSLNIDYPLIVADWLNIFTFLPRINVRLIFLFINNKLKYFTTIKKVPET